MDLFRFSKKPLHWPGTNVDREKPHETQYLAIRGGYNCSPLHGRNDGFSLGGANQSA